MFDFLSQKFSSLFSGLTTAKELTEDNIQESLDQVRDALLQADVPYTVVQSFIAAVKDEVVGQKIIGSLQPAEQLFKVVQDKVVAFLGEDPGIFAPKSPSVIMVMGLQGSGKTTTIGKLAHKLQQDAIRQGVPKKIMMASVDFYRPAAVEQLQVLAQRVSADFYRAEHTNPVFAAKEIFAHYNEQKYDYLLLDTAGRLHIDNGLLQELQDIDAVVQPRHKLLVLDAMTGQESLSVAQAFESMIGFHGAILTKMDSDTRGGSAFAFRYVLKKPIVFIGEGEHLGDLNAFFPDRAAERMLGMGDIQSLIERADEKISQEEQMKAEKALKSGTFSLQDFADQIAMMNRLGSLSQLMKYMPGVNIDVSPEMIHKGEVELAKFKAIIASMTLKERLDPSMLNSSRIQRVAQGAGVEDKDVTMLLKRFEEAKQYVKLLNKF